ncbi:cyclin-O protein B-like [Sinocyclocheilus rhinocerous]|uniref:cyclin-O protein B-like n=1 Tax=Sinocyclocheilus rhinocerous TaxID=307959 RepID=UPI0007BAB4F3|nr:PREDICTED: cyclin-O protein B-like [Sinocyclocheilus rhinocerous]
MSALSDSGFEEDLHASGSELQECDDEEESCFIIQRHNELQFLAHNCLARQPQVEVYSPRITQLLSLCCNSFSREQLCNLECLILLRLNFRLAAPTHAFFLDYFTSRTTGYQTDGAMDKMVTTQDRNAWKEPQKKWKWLACKVCELSLADYTFNKYMPSVIVLCAVKLAKDLLKTHSAQPTDNKAGSSKTLESFGFQEYPTFEAQVLVQQCTEDLKLLVSLNQDAVQDFISPLY